jgi:hypothetical protein
MLLGEQTVTRTIDRDGHPTDEIVNFSETHLRNGRGG